MAEPVIPIDKLPDVVLGRDPRFERAEAMALLAASSLPQREPVLAQVLENAQEPRQYRLVAAIVLGRILTDAAEKVLLHNLQAEHPAIHEVLKSLGRIGDRDALAAIERLKLPETHHAGGAARFAASLITYRLGIAGHDLPVPGEKELLRAEGTEAQRIDLRKLESGAAKAVIEAMRRFPYGRVDFDPEAVTHVQCAGESNMILINREFSAKGTLDRATTRKALFAIGALQSPETGDFSPSYLLFTHPSGTAGTVHMIVTRCSGAFAMAGDGRLVGDGGEYELRSVRRPGARAMLVRGTLADGIVRAAEAISSITREPPRTVRHAVVEGV